MTKQSQNELSSVSSKEKDDVARFVDWRSGPAMELITITSHRSRMAALIGKAKSIRYTANATEWSRLRKRLLGHTRVAR